MYTILDFDNNNDKNKFEDLATFKKKVKNNNLNKKFEYINNNKLKDIDIHKYKELDNIKNLHKYHFEKYNKNLIKFKKLKEYEFESILPKNDNNKNNLELKSKYDNLFKDIDRPIKSENIIQGYDFNNFEVDKVMNKLIKENNNKKLKNISCNNNNLTENKETNKDYLICKNYKLINKWLPNIYNTCMIYQNELVEMIIDELLLEEVYNLNYIDNLNNSEY